MLKHRFFLPSSLTSNNKVTKRYPLFIEIHGGGFIIGDPCADDQFCGWLAESCSAITVSINYRKSPKVQYPIPLEDCAATIKAILSDPDLPIDHDHVVIGGMSAGGNLALSIAQNEDFRGIFRGMLIWYPIADWTVPMQKRVEFRTRSNGPDRLLSVWRFFESAYIPPGLDWSNPALSPFYASPESFPKESFFVAADDDILSYDTYMMAQKLAGSKPRSNEEKGCLSAWRAGSVSFAVAHGQPHGFNQHKFKGEREAKRQEVVNELHERIKRWLCDDVFKSGAVNTHRNKKDV